MANGIDVEVHLSEVLLRLRDSGAFRQALREVAEAKAGGKEIANVRLTNKGGSGEISDDDLNAVVGGASAPTIDKSIAYPELKAKTLKLPQGMGFADTTW
jgi:hypothetical protein